MLMRKKVASKIAKTAQIEDGVTIGSNVSIWDYAHVRSGTKIGDNTIISRFVQVDTDVIIGSGCKIQNGVSVYHGVTIENDVFVGPAAVFTNDLNPRAFNKTWKITKTNVGKGASICANATIVCGNNLGEYCMVAAGAVVTKPVQPYQLVAGVPARHLGWINKEGKIISKDIEMPKEIKNLISN